MTFSQRGRELYTKMQYHFTPVNNFPFFLALAIPVAFSNEIESSKNLTDIIPMLRKVISNPGTSPVSGFPLSPHISISITGWFKDMGNSQNEIFRYLLRLLRLLRLSTREGKVRWI